MSPVVPSQEVSRETETKDESSSARFLAIYELRQHLYKFTDNRTLLAIARLRRGEDYELLKEVAEVVYGKQPLDVQREGRRMAQGTYTANICCSAVKSLRYPHWTQFKAVSPPKNAPADFGIYALGRHILCQRFKGIRARYPNVKSVYFDLVNIDLADSVDNADIEGTLGGHITMEYTLDLSDALPEVYPDRFLADRFTRTDRLHVLYDGQLNSYNAIREHQILALHDQADEPKLEDMVARYKLFTKMDDHNDMSKLETISMTFPHIDTIVQLDEFLRALSDAPLREIDLVRPHAHADGLWPHDVPAATTALTASDLPLVLRCFASDCPSLRKLRIALQWEDDMDAKAQHWDMSPLDGWQLDELAIHFTGAYDHRISIEHWLRQVSRVLASEHVVKIRMWSRYGIALEQAQVEGEWDRTVTEHVAARTSVIST